MPKQYKCRGANCFYETDDLGDFIAHSLDERVKPIHEEIKLLKEERRSKELAPPAPPKTKHETVKDFLACPDCYPKFEKAILEDPKFLEKLKQEGWRKERR